MRKVLREILITWLVIFGAMQTSGLDARTIDPTCKLSTAHLAPRPFPQWAQWSLKDWENFSKHLHVEAIEPIAIEKGGPYPLGHKDVLREFGINLDAGNIDFRIFFEAYYRRIAHAAKGDPEVGARAIFPTFEFSMPGNKRIAVRPGIDPPVDFSTAKLLLPGIMTHQEWAERYSRGFGPIDASNWNHDVGHLLTYALNPDYMKRLEEFYELQTAADPEAQEHFWMLSARLIDETGQRISDAQREHFESLLPSSFRQGMSDIRMTLKFMPLPERQKLAQLLIESRPSIMSPHGAITMQIGRYPNDTSVQSFGRILASQIAMGRRPYSMLPNFRATGFTASLYHKISLLKRVLEFQNEPDRIDSLVSDSQRQTRKPSPRTSELKMRAEILLNEILSEMIAQVIEGYRAYSDLKLSPEVYIDDLQSGTLDSESRTAKYLLVADPALRIALIYPPKPIGLKPD